MSLLSKQDHDLTIAALGIVIESEGETDDPAVAQMRQLLQWLKLQRQKLYGE